MNAEAEQRLPAWQAFRSYDQHGCGRIDMASLAQVLKATDRVPGLMRSSRFEWGFGKVRAFMPVGIRDLKWVLEVGSFKH